MRAECNFILWGDIKMKVSEENVEISSVGTITSLVPIQTTLARKKIVLIIERCAKRFIDIIGGIVGTLALIPITIVLYIANFISGDKGPVFFTQERIGQNGKVFKMYKYRSMVVGADEKLKEYLAENEEAREEYTKYKKLKYDPRVTKIGEFIRKTSIDEFPQFINVLKGDMSLVGPRPYLPREKEDINGFFNYIMSCKPGITGFWQVNGRNDVTFNDRLDMDMQYYYKHCLKLDIKLLMQTARKVVKREGAI